MQTKEKQEIKTNLEQVSKSYKRIWESETISEFYDNLSRYIDCYAAAREVISVIADHELQLIIKLRYIHFLTWEQISDITGFTFQWCHKLHNRALQYIQHA